MDYASAIALSVLLSAVAGVVVMFLLALLGLRVSVLDQRRRAARAQVARSLSLVHDHADLASAGRLPAEQVQRYRNLSESRQAG